MRYEAFSYADPVFYDSPVRWASVEEFAAAGAPIPDGWVGSVREVWVGRQPAGLELPDQGWKIHVSACLDNAEHILSVVAAYCYDRGVAFKFLRSSALVQTQNAKYASRGSSGKFMTLYPVDDAALEGCLDDLDTALAGQAGPYILSDLRWRRGPLFLRYGAFTELFCRSESGELVLALREPSGRLRPDVRRAVFEVPDWAPVPAVLAEALADRAGRAGADEFAYQVQRALHFSNGGGIYVARPAGGGQEVVLKEARPHAGLDQRGDDAVARLGRERDILHRLDGLSAVPAALDYFTAWEHHFLVQEYIEGEPLNRWFGRRYPLVHPDPSSQDIERYKAEALAVLDRIEEGLASIHERGVVFGDLHPRNLIVRPDGRVCFIDFELASPIEAFVRPGLGAAGFAAPPGLDGFDIDRYALAALRLWIFMPLLQLTSLHEDKRHQLATAAAARFSLPTPPATDPPPDPGIASGQGAGGPAQPPGEVSGEREVLDAAPSGGRADSPAPPPGGAIPVYGSAGAPVSGQRAGGPAQPSGEVSRDREGLGGASFDGERAGGSPSGMASPGPGAAGVPVSGERADGPASPPGGAIPQHGAAGALLSGERVEGSALVPGGASRERGALDAAPSGDGAEGPALWPDGAIAEHGGAAKALPEAGAAGVPVSGERADGPAQPPGGALAEPGPGSALSGRGRADGVASPPAASACAEDDAVAALVGAERAGRPASPPAASSSFPELDGLCALFSGDGADWPALRDSMAAAIAASATPERSDRLFPGDPNQFTHDGLGLAYGAAGVLWALDCTGCPVDPAHVRWLLDAVAREPCRPGLFTGSHGVALALDRLGHPRQAHNLLDHLLKDPLDAQGNDLAAGLPGIGLTLLHFAASTGDTGLQGAAVDVAGRLADRLRTPSPQSAVPAGGRSGLMHGATGAALFFLRLYETTGDRDLLDLAELALRRDLERCVLAEDGTLQVDDGSRVLPYLESGSAGIAAVLHTYLDHRPDEGLQESVERIRAAAEPEFIVQPGLFNGRAGLIWLLHLLGRDSGAFENVIRRHVQRLVWHAIPYGGQVAFPGEQLLRLSMDLATGSAGILLALGAVFEGTPTLPVWPAPPGTAPVPAPCEDQRAS
ncbi:class III lanthionine synthetase LanKC [Streptomyces sp. NPDC101117]|uniref:class III lanthionine synthetase LanKC n=1 Tax=Streptomyces sp. NPDC101117 TaxID=3366108 RepID=UPI00380BA32B